MLFFYTYAIFKEEKSKKINYDLSNCLYVNVCKKWYISAKAK